jgi:O-glycosyl hydrolase
MSLILHKTKTMKIKLLLLILCTLTLQAQTSITIHPDQRQQTVEGWGSTMIWWAHMVGQWEDEEKVDDIIKLITCPEKLNMNIFRYNIGGGDKPSHYTTATRKGHMANGKGVRAEMEGFLDSSNANYNWNRDAGQRKVMLKIKEQRPDVIFEAFSNSPPYWMTYSKCSAGNHNASQDNLKPEYYEAFCDYLVNVCLHYKETYDIEFKTLDPFNEPQTS